MQERQEIIHDENTETGECGDTHDKVFLFFSSSFLYIFKGINTNIHSSFYYIDNSSKRLCNIS